MTWHVREADQAALPRSTALVAAALPGERDDTDLMALLGADDPFKDRVIRLQVVADAVVVGTAIGHVEADRAYLDLIAVFGFCAWLALAATQASSLSALGRCAPADP